jgi:glycogen phosphorylase
VREYIEQHYIPAATAYRERSANNGAAGAQMVKWQHTLEQNWATLRFGEMKVVSDEGKNVFQVEVYLGSLDPDSIRVELYADGVNGGAPEKEEMRRGQPLTGANGYTFCGKVPATRPATDYTARAIPKHNGVAIPLENARILWQR